MTNRIRNFIEQKNAEVVELYQKGDHENGVKLAAVTCDLTKRYFGENDSEYVSSLCNFATLLQSTGKLDEAERLYRLAFTIGQRIQGSAKRMLPLILNNMAGLFRDQGRYGEAEEVFQQALHLVGDAPGPNHPDLAAILKHAGELQYHQGRYSKAEEFYRRALVIVEATFGSEHPEFAAALNSLGVLNRAQGRYREADVLYRAVLRIFERSLGPQHPQLVAPLYNLGKVQHHLGQYGAAEEFYRRALIIAEAALGSEHFETGKILNDMAAALRAQGRFTEAEPLVSRALAISEGISGENHELSRQLMNLAGLRLEQGRYSEAEELSRRALAMIEATLGAEHPELSEHLGASVTILGARGKYSEAEALARRALAIREKALGLEDPGLVDDHLSLATLYHTCGKYRAAEPHYHQALAIAEKKLGSEHPKIAHVLNNFAALRRAEGSYGEAERFYDRALAVAEVAFGPDHREVAGKMGNLAGLFREQGRYRKAEELYRRALEMTQRILGDRHPDTAIQLNNIALLYRNQARYSEAEELYRRALAICKSAFGAEHPNTATAVNNLAGLLHQQGKYAEAEELFRQAVRIREQALGSEHPDVARDHNNLARLYDDASNYDEAAALYARSLAILERTLGPHHPDVGKSLNNIGLFWLGRSDNLAAEGFFQRALSVRERALGQTHPDVAQTLINLGILSALKGEYDKAEKLFRRTLAVYEASFGPMHPDAALAVDNLASLACDQGKYAEAEQLYNRALTTWTAAYGPVHPNVAGTLSGLASVFAATGRTDEALALMERAVNIDDHMIRDVFTFGSEAQRLAYIQSLEARRYGYLSLVARYFPNSARVGGAFDLLLRRKGLAAEAMAAQRDAILGGHYPDLISQQQALAALRLRIAALMLAGPSSEEPVVHRELLARLTTEKKQMEADLARQIPETNLERQMEMVDRQAVAAALPKDAVLVEFVLYRPFDFEAIPSRGQSQWRPARYLSMVLAADDPEHIHMFDLGEAEPIDRMIAEFRSAVTGEVDSRSEAPVANIADVGEIVDDTWRFAGPAESRRESILESRGVSLRNAVFDPIVVAFGGRTRLFLAPDGDISRLAFEVLPLGGGRLIDSYRISYLSVGRDALRFAAPSASRADAALVAADPDFDLGMQAEALFYSTDPLGRRSRDLDRAGRGWRFNRLPGARREGEHIAALFGVLPMLDADVLEGRLKACRSPLVLHFATHGFFLPDQQLHPDKNNLSQGLVAPAEDRARLLSRLENPLLRSGLALAGANTWLERGMGQPEAEDGLLTAEDITGLDLLGTELVVLSACETGLGQVHAGEGVFGLRRAFALAGASTLVMSLWKVPDAHTGELIANFYRLLLAGEGRAEALRQAQLAMKEKHPDPYFWGAFICQGNPGVMPKT
jgi:tetratricopeptide (TPR) repeat protein